MKWITAMHAATIIPMSMQAQIIYIDDSGKGQQKESEDNCFKLTGSPVTDKVYNKLK